MAKAAPAAEGDGPKKSKKMLFIIVGVVLVLLIGGGAAAFLMMSGGGDEEEDGAPKKTAKAAKHADKHPPEFMPLENLVVNLADPGGTRYAQVGITLQLEDAPTGDTLKKFMPAIRNALIMTLSAATADALLTQEGKDALARSMLEQIQTASGLEPHGKADSPVQAVLFSSFIVQ